MLSLLFGICLFFVFGKILFFGMRVSWGILRLLFTVVFLPIILISMVIGGLVYIAFPILVLIGLGTLLLRE